MIPRQRKGLVLPSAGGSPVGVMMHTRAIGARCDCGGEWFPLENKCDVTIQNEVQG